VSRQPLTGTGTPEDADLARRRTRAGAGSAYQDALRRLARRDHSEAELRRALDRKGFPQDAIDRAVLRLRRAGHLDDPAFARRFARRRMLVSGLGGSRVSAELSARGVARSVAAAALLETLREVPERESLETQARKYWRQRSREEPARRMRGLWRFLLRRGFPAELVSETLHALWPRWTLRLEPVEAPEGGTEA